jgi:hypothetical protein
MFLRMLVTERSLHLATFAICEMLIITSVMLDALCDHLAENPGLYVEEMALFLWDEFKVLPSPV